MIKNVPHPILAGLALKVDLAALAFGERGGAGARGLHSVGDLVDSGLPLVGELLANEDAVEERGGDEDGDAGDGVAVGVVHAHVWVSVNLPDSALGAVVVVVEGGEEGPVRVSLDLGLANHPQGLVLGGSLGSGRWDDLPPLLGRGLANVRAAVSCAVVHLQGLGFDDSLDLADLISAAVRVDLRELAGTVPSSIAAVLAGAVLAVEMKILSHGDNKLLLCCSKPELLKAGRCCTL